MSECKNGCSGAGVTPSCLHFLVQRTMVFSSFSAEFLVSTSGVVSKKWIAGPTMATNSRIASLFAAGASPSLPADRDLDLERDRFWRPARPLSFAASCVTAAAHLR